MKILIDENLPIKLKHSFGDLHETLSARDMGWHGMRNGELLALLALNGFEVFVTMDKSLPNQQNLQKFAVAIVVLRGANNKLETLQNLVPKLLASLGQGVDAGEVKVIE